MLLWKKRSTISSGAGATTHAPSSGIMSMTFTKMHGLGNDFMVIDAITQPFDLSPEQMVGLARRDTGVGFDQCLVIEKSTQDAIDFFYRIFNADGQEVGQCGNGARCLARFVHHYGLTTQTTIRVATRTTTMTLYLNDDHSVTVDMGKPLLHPSQIPFTMNQQQALYTLPLNNDERANIHAISVGNPHAVMLVSDISTTPVSHIGPLISQHPLFPEQCNAGFMQIIDQDHLRLRVYERGCGETRACGSGAVAAAAVGRLFHQLNERITVHLPGGDLIVDWPSTEASICLTGPATFVYEGHLIS